MPFEWKSNTNGILIVVSKTCEFFYFFPIDSSLSYTSLKTISILYLLYYDYSIPEKKIKHLISSTSKQNLPCVDKRTTNIQDSNRKPWRDSVINPVRASRPSIHVRCEKAWQFVLMTRETRFVSPECVQIVHPRTVTSILFVVHELA